MSTPETDLGEITLLASHDFLRFGIGRSEQCLLYDLVILGCKRQADERDDVGQVELPIARRLAFNAGLRRQLAGQDHALGRTARENGSMFCQAAIIWFRTMFDMEPAISQTATVNYLLSWAACNASRPTSGLENKE